MKWLWIGLAKEHTWNRVSAQVWKLTMKTEAENRLTGKWDILYKIQLSLKRGPVSLAIIEFNKCCTAQG